jgi:hypothetical protein
VRWKFDPTRGLLLEQTGVVEVGEWVSCVSEGGKLIWLGSGEVAGDVNAEDAGDVDNNGLAGGTRPELVRHRDNRGS